jgi:selenocysteine lyase/cysteine desulfurase
MAAFTVARHTPAQVGDHLQRSGISAWTGHPGHAELLSAFGADEIGGATHVGIMPYTTRSEIDILLNALDGLGY